MVIICWKIVNFTRRMATGISFGRQRTIVPVIRQPLPSGILNIALSVTPRPAFFYPASRHHILILSVRRFIAINRTPALWLVSPDSYLCVLLDGHHKATAAALEGRPLKTLVLSTATHFNDEQQTLVFPGGNVCTKQSCNTTYQNSPRAKHYRPAHGRVSALISTSAHPKPGQKS